MPGNTQRRKPLFLSIDSLVEAVQHEISEILAGERTDGKPLAWEVSVGGIALVVDLGAGGGLGRGLAGGFHDEDENRGAG